MSRRWSRRLSDSGGGGEHRGGTGGEIAIVPHDAPQGGIHYVLSGKGSKFPQSEGMAGGDPGAINDYVWVHAPHDMAGLDHFAQSLDGIPGEKEAISWGVFPLMADDALYVRWNGGGGMGDSLERDAGSVLKDYEDSTISAEAMMSIYGVVLHGGDVDIEATRILRARMRQERSVQL